MSGSPTHLSGSPSIHRLLRKGNYAERLGAGAPVYLAVCGSCGGLPILVFSFIFFLYGRPSAANIYDKIVFGDCLAAKIGEGGRLRRQLS